MNDDDWELFVPVKGEKYPDACQYRYRRIDHGWSEWCRGPIGVADYPRNDVYQYRKPKQKENKMPDRTPQQALKDAIDSGAVEAWINGEAIESQAHGSSEWVLFPAESSAWPPFQSYGAWWRPKPPEPTRINWQPVVTGKEPKGWVLCAWVKHPAFVVHTAKFDGCWTDENEEDYLPPTHWAPMCNLPEEK